MRDNMISYDDSAGDQHGKVQKNNWIDGGSSERSSVKWNKDMVTPWVLLVPCSDWWTYVFRVARCRDSHRFKRYQLFKG